MKETPVNSGRSHYLQRRLLLAIIFSMLFSALSASHFRHGTISWRAISDRTIEFKISQAYQGYRNIGSESYMDNLEFGDRTSQNFAVLVTSSNAVEDWHYGEITIVHTYPASGNYTARFGGCCKISILKNNKDFGWNVETLVNVGNSLGNNSPVVTMAPLVNMQEGQSASTFNVSAVDQDNDHLTFRLATYDEMLGYQPEGISLDPITGVLSLNTTGKTAGELYNASVVVEDGKCKVINDFIIKIVRESTPPAFDYSVTPVHGSVFRIHPGQTITFPVKAVDFDSEDVVTLQAIGAPLGSVFSPSLPVSGNPIQSFFSWTPTETGTSVINFMAQERLGATVNSSVSIIVSLDPVFDIPPTPSSDVLQAVHPGQTISFPVQASDFESGDLVTITDVKRKDRVTGLPVNLYSGANFSPLPTMPANPTGGTFSWIPDVAHWGINSFYFYAQDTSGGRNRHEVKVLVNTTPSFTSQPVTSVNVGEVYAYQISATDVDSAYGDHLNLSTLGLPSWLNFSDNGDGTALLSGTPSVADRGSYLIQIVAQDTYHSYSPESIRFQSFNVEVDGCSITFSEDIKDASCSGTSDGGIVIISEDDAAYLYSIDGGLSYQSSNSFSNLSAGNYDLKVKQDATCESENKAVSLAVRDTIFPTVFTHASKVFYLDGYGAVTIAPSDIDSGSYDNCGISSLILDKTDFGCSQIGANEVLLTVTDVNGNVASSSTLIFINSSSPVIDSISGGGPIALGSSVNISGYYNGSSISAASWDWGNGVVTDGIVSGNLISGTYTYLNPGVYPVTLTLTSVCGETASLSYNYAVVYDPSGNFITGGGCIISPEGAYPGDPTLSGKAHFGFVSKYLKGATVPTGNAQFGFKAGDINFKSQSYEWLVISGGKGQFKGEGTINGSGIYGFILTGVDGHYNNGDDPDKFRIKIWDKFTGHLVYDNNIELSENDDPSIVISSGSIVIHNGGPSGSSSKLAASSSVVAATGVHFAPNPFTDFVTINLPETSGNWVHVEFVSESGRILKKEQIVTDGAAGFYTVSSGDIPKGICIVRIYNASENLGSFKLVKVN